MASERNTHRVSITGSTADHAKAESSAALSCVEDSRARRLLVLAGLLVAVAAMALSIDVVVADLCVNNKPNDDFLKFLQLTEYFGHGFGVAAILLAIYNLDFGRRWAIPRVLASAVAAGMAANLVKMMVVRTRPQHFDFVGDVWATFGGWLAMTGAGTGGQSFPSAHTATAVGLAVALIWLYPAGRWLFISAAALVGVHRIYVGAHFPSDVLCGAALALVVSRGIVVTGPVARWFDRLEEKLREKQQADEGSDADDNEQPRLPNAA